MQERLQWMRVSPTSWLNWLPLNGGLDAHRLVQQRYAQARCHLHEDSPTRHARAVSQLQAPWWQRWLGRDVLQTHRTAHEPVQMVWANMALHLAADPMGLIKQWQQALAVDGFVMFSCLGPDTLRELASLYQELHWPPPHHAFTDMHDWGDMLVQSGFAEPVMDMERLTLTYATPQALLQDLRQMGRNLHRERFAGLRGRGWLKHLHAQLLKLAQPQHDGRLVLTVEVIYGHAIKAAPRVPVSPTQTVSLQDMRAMLKPEMK